MNDIKRRLWIQFMLIISAMLLDFHKNTKFSVSSNSPNKSIET